MLAWGMMGEWERLWSFSVPRNVDCEGMLGERFSEREF